MAFGLPSAIQARSINSIAWGKYLIACFFDEEKTNLWHNSEFFLSGRTTCHPMIHSSMQEARFVNGIKHRPDDDKRRIGYAAWLDGRDDDRARFLRLQCALKVIAPDHVERLSCEHELSQLRSRISAEWVSWMEPL